MQGVLCYAAWQGMNPYGVLLPQLPPDQIAAILRPDWRATSAYTQLAEAMAGRSIEQIEVEVPAGLQGQQLPGRLVLARAPNNQVYGVLGPRIEDEPSVAMSMDMLSMATHVFRSQVSIQENHLLEDEGLSSDPDEVGSQDRAEESEPAFRGQASRKRKRDQQQGLSPEAASKRQNRKSARKRAARIKLPGRCGECGNNFKFVGYAIQHLWTHLGVITNSTRRQPPYRKDWVDGILTVYNTDNDAST